MIHCVFNAFTDLVVFLLPLPIIFGLQISKREKIILAIILPLGGISVLASIVRIVYYVRLIQLWPDADLTWMCTDNTIWCAIETAVAMVACSLFALKQLWKRDKKIKDREEAVVYSKGNSGLRRGVEFWSYVSVEEGLGADSGGLEDNEVCTNAADKRVVMVEVGGAAVIPNKLK